MALAVGMAFTWLDDVDCTCREAQWGEE